LTLVVNKRKIILVTRSEKFVSEAFDCIAQSPSAIKVSSRCHVNANFLFNHVTTGGQKWQEYHIAPVSVQRWALTSDMDGLLDFSFFF